MKTLIHTIIAALALAGVSLAGGIEGRVTDGNGNPLRGVTISAKGYGKQSTTTDSNGFYTLGVPSSGSNVRVDVYVNGLFAVNCLVPDGNANSKVNVTLIRR